MMIANTTSEPDGKPTDTRDSAGCAASTCWAWTTPDVDMPETYEPVIVAGSLEDDDGYMATHEAFWCGRNWWSVRQRETDPKAKKRIHNVTHWTRMPSLPNDQVEARRDGAPIAEKP